MSDVVDQLKREAKRKRDNMRSNELGHPYVKFMEDDAIERIATLEAENERLENLLAQGVHTCSSQCKRPLCVLRRENRGLREAAQAVVDVYKNYDDTDYFRGSETEVHISELAKALEQGD